MERRRQIAFILHLFTPSILGFTYSSDGPAATNLWMQVPESSPSAGGDKDWGKTTVLWHENKWYNKKIVSHTKGNRIL
jgi:hypothetical protein